MKKSTLFSTFQGQCMEVEIPPFSVFLGTSMRATFHIKFSDGHRFNCSILSYLIVETHGHMDRALERPGVQFPVVMC